MAPTNKCLAQSNKSCTGGKATKEAENPSRQRGAVSLLAKLANGKTRYRVSAAGYFMTE